MDSALPPPLSEYPGIPGILGRSWYHRRMDTAHPPYLSILGFLGYSDDPGIIPGWTQLYSPPPLSEYPGIPGIFGRSWDHPRMDTALPHPPPPRPSIPGIPGYSDRGGGMSCVHPGMIPGSSEYPRNPRILRQGGGG